jgi:uncharacterized protein
MWAVALTVIVLAARNVAGERFIPSALYVPVNLGVVAVLVLIALQQRVSLSELGLSRARLPAGLLVGLAIAAGIAAALAAGAALPLTRGFFEDERIADIDGAGGLAYQTLIRIPIGTVLHEEFAFRGLLLALLMRLYPTAVAVGVSSLLFGLWHIHPTLDALAANDLAESTIETAGAVTGAVVITAIGGVIFCMLRLWTGSLLAPIVTHIATNSFGTAAAYLVLRD